MIKNNNVRKRINKFLSFLDNYSTKAEKKLGEFIAGLKKIKDENGKAILKEIRMVDDDTIKRIAKEKGKEPPNLFTGIYETDTGIIYLSKDRAKAGTLLHELGHALQKKFGIFDEIEKLTSTLKGTTKYNAYKLLSDKTCRNIISDASAEVLIYKTLGEADWVREALWKATIERNYKGVIAHLINKRWVEIDNKKIIAHYIDDKTILMYVRCKIVTEELGLTDRVINLKGVIKTYYLKEIEDTYTTYNLNKLFKSKNFVLSFKDIEEIVEGEESGLLLKIELFNKCYGQDKNIIKGSINPYSRYNLFYEIVKEIVENTKKVIK